MIRRILHIILLSGLIVFIYSCNATNADETNLDKIPEESDNEYQDGTWCADVEYYNPNTGTRNTYKLNVEVENNQLIEIDWPNGGWLDETHFNAEDISDGECSITSDRGYEYTITLDSKGGCNSTDAFRLQRDVEDDEEAITCPKCGDEKDDSDDLCYSCERKQKRAEEEAETCPVCYGYKMEWEKICNNCKQEKEEKTDLDEDN